MTNINIGKIQPPPVKILPTLFLLPDLVVGIPVALAIRRFTFVIPNARFVLNDKPGIPLFFLPIYLFLLFIKSIFLVFI